MRCILGIAVVGLSIGCSGSGSGGGSGVDSGLGGGGGGLGAAGGTGGSGAAAGGSAGSGGIAGGGSGGSTGGASGACVPQSAECYVTGPGGPGAACLAKQDNAGQSKWQARMTSLELKAPAALSKPFVQEAVIDKATALDQLACFEFGTATLSWLLELDPSAGTLKTGGGMPVTDPQAGTCFAALTTPPLTVGPVVTGAIIDGGNLHFAAQVPSLNLPIFSSPSDSTISFILPLRGLSIAGTFSDASHDCIGKFNGPELNPINSCLPDTKAIPPQRAWTTGGSAHGFISIAEADQVMVTELGASLCVLLAGAQWKGPNGDCASSNPWISGNRPDGDWCVATNAAATTSCHDAYRFEAAFAAAGFAIQAAVCP